MSGSQQRRVYLTLGNGSRFAWKAAELLIISICNAYTSVEINLEYY